MQTVEIPFGEWLPDKADYKNPGCLVADNVWPTSDGYSPFLGKNTTGDENTEAVLGAQQMFRNDGTSVIVGGSDTRLFVLVSSTLTATTGYTSIGDNAWDFAQFNDYVVAVAPNNDVQYLTDIDSDTGWSALPGSPPRAKVVGRVGNFLVLGNLSTLGLPTSIQWSAENDPTDWPTPGTADARVKSSGRAALQTEYGAITGIAGDRYPLIFQERGIFRMTPIGPPDHFNVRDAVSEARGCIAPQSIVTVGWMTFFLSHDGFWATDGNQIFPIGTQKINDWFRATVSETDRFRTQGTVVWEKQSIIWSFYPASNNTGFRRQLIYSWAENRWSTASLYVDWIVDNKVGATTLEALDALFPSGIETVDPHLDSSYWGAKSRVLSAFAQDGAGNSELYLLNGSALEATFETGEFEPAPGKRVAINGVYPIVENADTNTTAGVVTRDYKGGTETTSSLTTINAAGFCPVRADGRFARAKMVIPASASWDAAQGVQAEFRVSGRR